MQAKPGQLVDHRNGNGLDCQKSNMRLCGYSQNNSNSRKRKGKSQFKGVVHRTRNCWAAWVCVNGKNRYLGSHKTEEAAAAYDKAAQQYFGEFARLNFSEVAQ